MPGIAVLQKEIASDTLRPADSRGSLIFLHGAGCDSRLWANQMSNLPSGFAGFALDLPGHGCSEGEPSNSIGEYARAVANFIREADAPRPIYLVGQSMGSAIALTIALEYRPLIDGLVISAGGAHMGVNTALLEAMAAGQADPAIFKLSFSRQTDPVLVETFIAQQAQVPISVFYNDFFACSLFDVQEEVHQIDLPTLIVVGSDDKMTPPRLGKYLHEKIKGSLFEIIDGAGHMLMLEKPDELNMLIENFVIK